MYGIDAAETTSGSAGTRSTPPHRPTPPPRPARREPQDAHSPLVIHHAQEGSQGCCGAARARRVQHHAPRRVHRVRLLLAAVRSQVRRQVAQVDPARVRGVV